MVTASHNDNGWTGVKMGANGPLTFAPMRTLKEIACRFQKRGRFLSVSREFSARYIADLTKRPKLKRKPSRGRLRQRHRGRLRTAGHGSDRLRGDPVDTELDHTFPKPIESKTWMPRDPRRGMSTRPTSPGPTVMAIAAVWSDNTGEEILPTRWRMLARDMLGDGTTGLPVTDPVLQKRARNRLLEDGLYMKRCTNEMGVRPSTSCRATTACLGDRDLRCWTAPDAMAET
jgi:phosphomannomutase/phosphoglucomutase